MTSGGANVILAVERAGIAALTFARITVIDSVWHQYGLDSSPVCALIRAPGSLSIGNSRLARSALAHRIDDPSYVSRCRRGRISRRSRSMSAPPYCRSRSPHLNESGCNPCSTKQFCGHYLSGARQPQSVRRGDHRPSANPAPISLSGRHFASVDRKVSIVSIANEVLRPTWMPWSPRRVMLWVYPWTLPTWVVALGRSDLWHGEGPVILRAGKCDRA